MTLSPPKKNTLNLNCLLQSRVVIALSFTKPFYAPSREQVWRWGPLTQWANQRASVDIEDPFGILHRKPCIHWVFIYMAALRVMKVAINMYSGQFFFLTPSLTLSRLVLASSSCPQQLDQECDFFTSFMVEPWVHQPQQMDNELSLMRPNHGFFCWDRVPSDSRCYWRSCPGAGNCTVMLGFGNWFHMQSPNLACTVAESDGTMSDNHVRGR